MKEAGIFDQGLVFRGGFNQDNGYENTLKALKLFSPPTAIFAANNFIAIGALKALRAAGMRVPEDVSLVACDDLPEAMSVDPSLTVLNQPAYQMGYTAATLLIDDHSPTLQSVIDVCLKWSENIYAESMLYSMAPSGAEATEIGRAHV